MTWGVKFVLLANLTVNIGLIAVATANLIFKVTGMSLGSYETECLILCFALAGVPIILMGFNGVRYRNEVQIRCYLCYMWLSIAISTVLIAWQFVFTGACSHLPSFFRNEGQAWACGVSRYIHVLITVVSFSTLAYFQHIVYSHCEDLAEMGGGPELADLMLNKESYAKRHNPQNAYSSIEGMASIKDAGGFWETAVLGRDSYDSSVSSGMGGGASLFGGKCHEMNYPPSITGSGQQDQTV